MVSETEQTEQSRWKPYTPFVGINGALYSCVCGDSGGPAEDVSCMWRLSYAGFDACGFDACGFDVCGFDACRVDRAGEFDHTNRESCDIEVTGFVDVGHLGALAPDQGTAGDLATTRDTFDDLRGLGRIDATETEVVEEEDRPVLSVFDEGPGVLAPARQPLDRLAPGREGVGEHRVGERIAR